MIEKLPVVEDFQTEFKQVWTQTAEKTLIAFANGLGGTLFFGIRDDGVPMGLSKKDADQITRSVALFCRNGVEPPMSNLLKFQCESIDESKVVLRVDVQRGNTRPYGFKGRRFSGGAYVRDRKSVV